ncbi:carbonyl reductase [NADPH] 1-like protein [Powellomyces hirtus]|nr:carbonyl reductase [NADPH] 1-like protein [Powellomyces hirtus]
MTDKKQVFVVTGANKGIGKEIVLELAKKVKEPALIYVAARDQTRGQAAVEEIRQKVQGGKTEVEFLPLDISNEQSIKDAVSHIKSGPGYVDVLINNAGIASKGDAFDRQIAATTVGTNYTGTKNTSLAFLPLIRENGRVIIVSSMAGKLSILSPELQAKFSSPSLTLEELDMLMQSFVQAVEDGTYADKGWPKQAYGTSKVGCTALSLVLSRLPEVQKKNIFVAACCPGWCKTDMAGDKAPLTATDGAQTPVMLATAATSGLENGAYYKDQKLAKW